jgi:hypothetical protein
MGESVTPAPHKVPLEVSDPSAVRVFLPNAVLDLPPCHAQLQISGRGEVILSSARLPYKQLVSISHFSCRPDASRRWLPTVWVLVGLNSV